MKFQWLPLLVMPCFATGFMTSYIIAWKQEHISWLLPCISDTGTIHPESCIFSQSMNMGAFLYTCFVILRNLQLTELHKECHFPKYILILNQLAFYVGLFSAFGISVCGNFQKSKVWKIHYLGAVAALCGGFGYVVIETIITCLLDPPLCSKLMRNLRIMFAMLCFFSGILCFKSLQIACDRCCRGKVCLQKLVWNANDPGYAWHALGAFGEWVLFYSLTTFLVTYYTEFQEVDFYSHVKCKNITRNEH